MLNSIHLNSLAYLTHIEKKKYIYMILNFYKHVTNNLFDIFLFNRLVDPSV